MNVLQARDVSIPHSGFSKYGDEEDLFAKSVPFFGEFDRFQIAFDRWSYIIEQLVQKLVGRWQNHAMDKSCTYIELLIMAV